MADLILLTKNDFIEVPTPKSFWQHAAEYRKAATEDVPAPIVEPVFNAKATTEILKNYIEDVTPELLSILKHNKERLAHMEPIPGQTAWLTALVEFEEQCKLDKAINEVEQMLLPSIPKASINKAKELFIKQYPGLEYLCSECFLDKANLIHARRTKDAADFIAFKNNLPKDLVEKISVYENFRSLEIKYWQAKNNVPYFNRIKQTIRFIRKNKYVDERKDVVDPSQIEFYLGSDLDINFSRAFVHCDEQGNHYVNTMFRVSEANECINDLIKSAQNAIDNYVSEAHRKKTVEIELYKSLKEHGIVPPAGMIRNVYLRFENSKQV